VQSLQILHSFAAVAGIWWRTGLLTRICVVAAFCVSAAPAKGGTLPARSVDWWRCTARKLPNSCCSQEFTMPPTWCSGGCPAAAGTACRGRVALRGTASGGDSLQTDAPAAGCSCRSRPGRGRRGMLLNSCCTGMPAAPDGGLGSCQPSNHSTCVLSVSGHTEVSVLVKLHPRCVRQ
jgi:hypothetical protein